MTTTVFDKTLAGFSFVDTVRGDTLQRIAARTMGDASLWYQLISPNGLIPPYITDDPTQAGTGVLLTGKPILVPAPTAVASSVDPAQVFGTDVALQNGLLTGDGSGNLAFCTGNANLKQALQNRVSTTQGELIYHMTYGSTFANLIGTGATAAAELLAVRDAKQTLLADPRVDSVTSATAKLTGDSMAVVAVVQPVVGQSVSVSASS
jgi:phage baseplate assembly protein W